MFPLVTSLQESHCLGLAVDILEGLECKRVDCRLVFAKLLNAARLLRIVYHSSFHGFHHLSYVLALHLGQTPQRRPQSSEYRQTRPE